MNQISNINDINEIEAKFNKIFEESDGHAISISNHGKFAKNVPLNLTYGEISFKAFHSIFSQINLSEKKHFVDLGSGIGTVLVAAGLCHPFETITGIELITALSNESKRLIGTLKNSKSIFTVVEGYLEDYDISLADIVFAHSTCFPDETMYALDQKAPSMKSGSIIITITKPLVTDQLKLIAKDMVTMKWGNASVFIYERI
jgi:precorrin-6B methylase 2